MDKVALLSAFRARLNARIEEAELAQRRAAEGTRVDGSHRPANRGERAAVSGQGYLAAGLGQRIAALNLQLQGLDRLDLTPQEAIAVGSLVCLQYEDETTRWWLILEGGDGQQLDHGEASARVISPHSPIGQALMGLEVDDDVGLPTADPTANAAVIVEVL